MTAGLVKLCGVRTPADAALCAAAGADEVGIVFAATSRRRVDLETARAIRAALPARVALVGVFLAPTAEQLRTAVEAAGLDAVQLHGPLPPGLTGIDAPRWIRGLAGTLPLPPLEDLPWTRLLLDSPHGGGSGRTFDWSLARSARRAPLQLFVAGGLSPDNVAHAIAQAAPDGVDVASGIEGADGFKDPARVEAFVAAARAAFPSRPPPLLP